VVYKRLVVREEGEFSDADVQILVKKNKLFRKLWCIHTVREGINFLAILYERLLCKAPDY